MSEGKLMRYIAQKKVVSFAILFIFVYFGAWNDCSQYFDWNVKYYAECSPARNEPGRAPPRNTATNAPPRFAKSPPSTPFTTQSSTTVRETTTKPSHCIQHAPIDLKDPHYAIEMHPVSRLHEIQAKLHQSEPIFKVIGHRGDENKNNHEYNVRVVVNEKTESAWAHTKREAKRQAAIAMLNRMGLPVEGDGTNAIC